MKSVALIPARGGSKSVKEKNLREISGVSLVEITIKHARSSEMISDIYVSSDSEDILQIARALNCIAVKRSALTSTDTASANEVVNEFLNDASIALTNKDRIVYLQPTSPFREHGLIDSGLKLYDERNKPVVGVAEVSQHPQKMLKMNAFGTLEGYQQESDPTANRQTLPTVFLATGSLYIFSVADFLETRQIPVNGAIPYIVSGVNTFDIDSEMDLKVAQEIGKLYEF